MARDVPTGGGAELSFTTGTPITAAPFTMACKFNPDEETLDRALMSLRNSDGSQRFSLVAVGSASDVLQAQTTIASVTTGAASTTAGYDAGTWYHACAVYASSTSRAAYINGANKGTSAVSAAPSGIDRVRLAVDYDGKIAEAAIWNVALTDAEVLLASKAVSPLMVRPDALVAYWPMIGKYSPEIDVVGTYPLTISGTVPAADHPRVIYVAGGSPSALVSSTSPILRTLGPVVIEYSIPALDVQAPVNRALGPVPYEYTIPELAHDSFFDVPIGPVPYEYTINDINPEREVAIPTVPYEYTIPALHFINEGVELGPVPYEYTIPTMDAEINVNRTIGPVLYEYGIPILQGDYEILRDLVPVLYVYTVNAPNRKTTPVVIRTVTRYPVVFVHSRDWPRHQIAVLTSANAIDRSFVAMQPGKNGRDTGQAQLSVSARDAQLSGDVLQHGQIIVVESAGFPVWAGPILGLEEDPRTGQIDVSALGIEALLDGRVTRQPERFVKSIGELAVLRTLLDQANARNATGILASLRLATGQPISELQTGGQSVMEALNEMTTRTGSEWWVDIVRTPRKVDASLHLGYRQGMDLSKTMHLYEGVHFSGRYKSDLSQVKQSVVVVGDFGQEMDERTSVAHGFGLSSGDFGTPSWEDAREKVRRASLSMPVRNERVEYELMTGNVRELAASAARAHERPIGAGEMFQDVVYLPVVDPTNLRPGNRWTRHGMHKGARLERTVRMLSVQPDEQAGTALVISEVVV
jgi:hypothetical protein